MSTSAFNKPRVIRSCSYHPYDIHTLLIGKKIISLVYFQGTEAATGRIL